MLACKNGVADKTQCMHVFTVMDCVNLGTEFHYKHELIKHTASYNR